MAWTDPDGTLHETYIGTLIAEGVFLGQFTYDSGQAAYGWNRQGLAYFCQDCGEVWGRVVAQNERGEQQSFRCIPAPCRQHRDPWDVPGTFLRESFSTRLNDLPPDALRREFFLHLNYFEQAS